MKQFNKKAIIPLFWIIGVILIIVVGLLIYQYINKPVLPQIKSTPQEKSCEEKYDLTCLGLTRDGIEKCYIAFPSAPDGSHIPFKTAEAVCEGVFPGFPQYKCFIQGTDGILRVYFSQMELDKCVKR